MHTAQGVHSAFRPASPTGNIGNISVNELASIKIALAACFASLGTSTIRARMEIGMKKKAFASTTLFMESVSSERLLSCLIAYSVPIVHITLMLHLVYLPSQLTGTATPSRHAMNGNIRHTDRIFGTAYHLPPYWFLSPHDLLLLLTSLGILTNYLPSSFPRYTYFPPTTINQTRRTYPKRKH